jgi:tRNA 5-methylaminomethyl-2-thiouridine biosynthesis bifunctional protein
MKTAPVVPAALAADDQGVPYSAEYGDVYHPHAGALQQAQHVFLAGNGLPARWGGRSDFVILETGFGLGSNFLATWQAWRDDPARCERLVFLSVEARPLTRADLATIERAAALQERADELAAAWPPLTPNLHTLAFEGGRVRLLLALGDVEAWLPEVVASVDAFYLDGFAPARNPRMWGLRVCKALGRLANPGATLATWTAARAVRDALVTAGFEVREAPGAGGKRDITLARYAPRHTPRRAVARSTPRADGHALIVGGGLAGCSAAWALAEQGWTSHILDRHAAPAAEASGNPAGLFHGSLHADDGTHARFSRAAALMAVREIQTAIAQHGVRGSTAGLLRIETSLDGAAMQRLLARTGMPPDYVQALDAAEASVRAGLALTTPAWFYPGGGWVEPAALCRAFLERAGARARWRGGIAVQRLRATGDRWELLDENGEVIDAASTVVLANAIDAHRLCPEAGWPLDAVRGQLSRIRAAPGLPGPSLPLAGAGYLLPAIDGRLLFGATSQPGDPDPTVRRADHVANLAQLGRLIGHAPGDATEWDGRTAWRATAPDRLPLIGAVPGLTTPQTASARLDQPRLVPRLPGLYVYSALASRGITWCALGARLLAAWVTGAPAPLEASLIDAVDPARYTTRRYNQRS